MKQFKVEAVIIALGLLSMGVFTYCGISKFVAKDRIVTVKGLSEREVPADKVIWPITYKEVGNDMTTLYQQINKKNTAIITFLKANQIKESEISVSAADIVDGMADRYSNNNNNAPRYMATSVITVNSDQVDKVRELMGMQSELLKQGIAITTGDYRYNVQYVFTKFNDIKPEMIEQATANARTAAQKFAKDSDSELGKIRTATQGQFSINDRDANTPHIKSIRVVSTIEYQLED